MHHESADITPRSSAVSTLGKVRSVGSHVVLMGESGRAPVARCHEQFAHPPEGLGDEERVLCGEDSSLFYSEHAASGCSMRREVQRPAVGQHGGAALHRLRLQLAGADSLRSGAPGSLVGNASTTPKEPTADVA
jgi:hypothetical protein